MISRAIEIVPGSSRRDVDELLQSPSASASRTSSRVNHAASAISPSLKENCSSGSAIAWKPDHQRSGERPRLAAEVADVAHVQADLLGDLAHDARLERLAGLDEPRQQRKEPLGPHRLAGEHGAVAAVVHQADHRRVDAGKLFVTADGVDA